eukprot:gene18653-5411_t
MPPCAAPQRRAATNTAPRRALTVRRLGCTVVRGGDGARKRLITHTHFRRSDAERGVSGDPSRRLGELATMLRDGWADCSAGRGREELGGGADLAAAQRVGGGWNATGAPDVILSRTPPPDVDGSGGSVEYGDAGNAAGGSAGAAVVLALATPAPPIRPRGSLGFETMCA